MPATPKPTAASPISFSPELVGVSQRFLAEGWQVALPMLRPAIARSHGRLSAPTVHEALHNRAYQLWLVVTDEPIAALVTEVVVWPTGLKVARFVLAGGRDSHLWLDLLPRLEAWACAEGCTLFEAGGRPGWQRVFRGLEGWRLFGVQMQKDLSERN